MAYKEALGAVLAVGLVYGGVQLLNDNIEIPQGPCHVDKLPCYVEVPTLHTFQYEPDWYNILYKHFDSMTSEQIEALGFTEIPLVEKFEYLVAMIRVVTARMDQQDSLGYIHADPRIFLGQAAWETFFGSSRLAEEANNHFGMKLSDYCSPANFTVTDDAPDEEFCGFDDIEQSLEEYLRRSQGSNPAAGEFGLEWYRDAIHCASDNPYTYLYFIINEGNASCQEVRHQGTGTPEDPVFSYATSEEYVDKVVDIVNRLGLDLIFHLDS